MGECLDLRVGLDEEKGHNQYGVRYCHANKQIKLFNKFSFSKINAAMGLRVEINTLKIEHF